MKLRTSLLLIVLVVALVGGACGGAETGGGLTDAPPWGLDNVEIPDTQEDIAAVFAAFPEEVGGRSRSGGGSFSAVYGESVVAWSIGAMDSEVLQTQADSEAGGEALAHAFVTTADG
ncbi:MAG: hypothetical protein OEM81_11250 [Acidimicrobiia bacterium]|nr:hypothetical protein [Acidimicrobiia bacterium]MDH3398389.1 hypothetical protein [Acidimicrobiia bacterium]